MAKACPQCGVLVDERFQVCDDCGYDWSQTPPNRAGRRAYQSRQARNRPLSAATALLVCLVLTPVIIGLLLLALFLFS